MNTKQLITQLQKLDPEGECTINGLHFAERLPAYYDGPTNEPEYGENYPSKYFIRREGKDKINLHMLWPSDFAFDIYHDNLLNKTQYDPDIIAVDDYLGQVSKRIEEIKNNAKDSIDKMYENNKDFYDTLIKKHNPMAI